MDASNPPYNSGQGVGGWAKFCGLNNFARGYAQFFQVNPRYSGLMDYLRTCGLNGWTPDPNTCAQMIADAGFGGSDYAAYYQLLIGYMDSVYSDSNYC